MKDLIILHSKFLNPSIFARITILEFYALVFISIKSNRFYFLGVKTQIFSTEPTNSANFCYNKLFGTVC